MTWRFVPHSRSWCARNCSGVHRSCLRKVRRWTNTPSIRTVDRMATTSAQTLRGAGPAIMIGGLPRAGVLMERAVDVEEVDREHVLVLTPQLPVRARTTDPGLRPIGGRHLAGRRGHSVACETIVADRRNPMYVRITRGRFQPERIDDVEALS